MMADMAAMAAKVLRQSTGFPRPEGYTMNPSSEVNIDRLNEMLNYDPDSGVFTWKKKPNRAYEKARHLLHPWSQP